MTFWSGDKGRKADRWGFDKGLVAPEWEWFWRDCLGAWIMWEGGGDLVRDYSKVRNPGTIDTSSGDVLWTTGPRGPALFLSGDATNDRVDLGSIDPSFNRLGLRTADANNDSVSFIWAGVPATQSGSAPRVIDKSDAGNAANGYAIWRDDTRFAFAINTVQFLSNTGILVVDQYDVWGLDHLVGGGDSLADYYLNGFFVNQTAGSVPGSGPAYRPDITNAAIGNWNHTTARMWDGTLNFVYVFQPQIGALRQLQIAQDPFGPFRMVDETEIAVLPVAAVAAADSIWPILWRRRRR